MTSERPTSMILLLLSLATASGSGALFGVLNEPTSASAAMLGTAAIIGAVAGSWAWISLLLLLQSQRTK